MDTNLDRLTAAEKLAVPQVLYNRVRRDLYIDGPDTAGSTSELVEEYTEPSQKYEDPKIPSCPSREQILEVYTKFRRDEAVSLPSIRNYTPNSHYPNNSDKDEKRRGDDPNDVAPLEP